MWKSKHYVDRSSGFLCVGSAAPPPILQTWVPAMKLKEPFRGLRFPTLNDLNLGMTRHIRDLDSNGLLDGVKKLPYRWKCVIEARGTTLNNVMWKLTWMNKFDWFLAVCALLLKWTSYINSNSQRKMGNIFYIWKWHRHWNWGGGGGGGGGGVGGGRAIILTCYYHQPKCKLPLLTKRWHVRKIWEKFVLRVAK